MQKIHVQHAADSYTTKHGQHRTVWREPKPTGATPRVERFKALTGLNLSPDMLHTSLTFDLSGRDKPANASCMHECQKVQAYAKKTEKQQQASRHQPQVHHAIVSSD